MAEDLSIEILKQIRDGITSMDQRLGHRIDQTNARLDQTNARLDDVTGRLERVDVRLGRVEQGLLDFGKFMKTIAVELTKYERFHAQHLRLVEKDLSSVKRRVEKLEKRKA